MSRTTRDSRYDCVAAQGRLEHICAWEFPAQLTREEWDYLRQWTWTARDALRSIAEMESPLGVEYAAECYNDAQKLAREALA